MNKTYAIVLAIFSSTFCFSQDIITTRSGDDIEAKVLKVGLTEEPIRQSRRSFIFDFEIRNSSHPL